jgi:hypothetical protein
MTWQVPGHGNLVLSTSTLMVRDEPYHLPVEMARGTLNRLRNQRAAWEMAGLVVEPGIDEMIRSATQSLVEATTNQRSPAKAAVAADQSVACSLDAIHQLGRQYTEQALSVRRRNGVKLSTFFAGNLGTHVPGEAGTKVLAGSFNAAVVPMSWSVLEANAGAPDWGRTDAQIQWCANNKLKVCAGPLLKLDRLNLPDWLFLWEDDIAQVQSYIQKHLEAVVRRYKGKVHVWHAAAGTNLMDVLGLEEEQRLRLTVSAIDAIRAVDPRTPIILSFDQPWGEYMGRQSFDLAPLHFADALVRAELGLAGIGLEINLGYWPGGTLPRDLIEISLQIDRWAMLGMPLVVTLTVPSSSAADPRAQLPVEVLSSTPGTLDPRTQSVLVDKIVTLLLAKQCVQGIIWNQLHDGQRHPFPHGGLIDSQGIAKPVLQALAAIRREHLL